MPIDTREFLSGDWEPAPEYKGTGTSKYALVFQPHPESGGPFGGRDNAAMSLLGLLRKTRTPFEQALDFTLYWNQKYCFPPLSENDLRDKVARAWVEWDEGDTEWAVPGEGEKGEIEFLDLPGMAEAEAKAGALTWIVEGGIPDKGLVYLSAPPAGAKSWVLMDLARALIEGDNWLDSFPVEPRRVLYIDEEMGVVKALPRLRRLGLPATAEGFWYTDRQGVQLDKPKDVQTIIDFCEAKGVSVVLVDTLTRVHSLDENDNSKMRWMFKQFRALMAAGLTVIVAHHNRKTSLQDGQIAHEKMRGAGEIAAAADMAFNIEKEEGYYSLTCSKPRLVSEDEAISVDFSLEDDGGYTRVVAIDAREKQEAREAEARAACLRSVGRFPATLKEIARKAGLTQERAREALLQLENNNKVECATHNKVQTWMIHGA